MVASRACSIFPWLYILLAFAQAAPSYEWKGCENLGKCQLNGYDTPPLVILSFDGFAREYLDRKIVKSLDYLAECGAKAERVFPSFPSKTFPNHYTMVTGLYPESHGIVDNSVFDLQLSSELEKMRTKKGNPYYGGEPIWSVYKRLTGRPAHCFFWIGCPHNNTGYKPDVTLDYNQSLSLDSRIETLLGWLRLPKETRPGLITAYLHQPDDAGHNQKSPKDVDDALVMVDEYMDKLFTAFHKENLLECINLVIVSDHGMQPLNRSVDISGHVKEDGLIVVKGVVTRIHINDT
uniref:Uncharacterized protein n=1 Tax=Caenorhabditis japonica TaxID=281687 RepID=A0A8R1HR88_CAEJA